MPNNEKNSGRQRLNVEAWLGQGFAASTKRVYRLAIETFLVFLNETEPEGWTVKRIVDERVKDLQERKFWFEQKVVEFHGWLKDFRTPKKTVTIHRRHYLSGRVHPVTSHYKGGNTLSDKTRQNYIAAVRSLFSFHRADLRFTRQQRRLITKTPKAVYRDYLFGLEDVTTMANVGSPQERYILLAGKDLGLRATDFAALTQGLFAKAIEKEPPVFLGQIYTQKEGIYAFPFLTLDGLEAAKIWLQILKSKGERDDKALMLKISRKELTPNLKRLAVKAGIDTHGCRVRFHCLRKFLIDRISLRMSESKWKQIIGKRIAEAAYVSPFELRDAYMNVLDYIQTGRVQPFGLNQEEIKMLRKILRLVKKGKIKISV